MSTILIIADNERIPGSLTEALTRHGYRILTASSGTDALSQCGTVQPDLIIVDIPRLDVGEWKTLRLLREIAQVPIIALGDRRAEIHSLDSGADHFVEKPFGAREVCARVRALLRRAKARPMYSTGQGLRTFWPADKAAIEEIVP